MTPHFQNNSLISILMPRINRLVRSPPARIFALRRPDSFSSSPCLEEGSLGQLCTLSPIDVADLISIRCNRSIKSAVAGILPAESTEPSLDSLVSRAIDLSHSMDPILLVRIFSTVSRLSGMSDVILCGLIGAVLDKCESLSLGSLSRFVFSVIAVQNLPAETRSRALACAAARTLTLLEPHNKTPPRVLSKLCVAFSCLGSTVDADRLLWRKLGALIEAGVPTLEPCHIQQITFSLTRANIRESVLIEALLRKAVQVSPVRNGLTYVNMLVSFHRSPVLNKSSEDWKIFVRIFRDHLGLGQGYVSRSHLASRLNACSLNLSEKQFQRLLNSLKTS